jgi:hypothetical protein
MPKKEIHIGKLIKKKMEEDGRKMAWLAEKMCRTRNWVYQIHKQKHIHPSLLIEISIFLNTNLFSPYFENVNERIQEKNNKM